MLPDQPESTGGQPESKLRRSAVFLYRVALSFVENRCLVRASALSYTTLLALVPLLAIAISVTTSLIKKQGEEKIGEFIDSLVTKVAPQLDLVTKAEEGRSATATKEVAIKISHFVGNVRSGTMGVTSMVALVFVAISLLRTIESAFNDIWGGTRGRPFLTSLVQYWAAITLGPLLLVVVVGLSTGSHLQFTQAWIARLPMAGQVFALFLLQFVPFTLTIFGFGLFYALMPNTRVHWLSALVGGAVGGTLWQLNSLFSIIYVSKVVAYRNIYGSLGILPVFLLGMYVSWVILLFGAQVAFAFQHREAYGAASDSRSKNIRDLESVCCQVAIRIVQDFQNTKPPPGLDTLASDLALPQTLVQESIQILMHHKLVCEVAGPSVGYTPRIDPKRIPLQQVIEAARQGMPHNQSQLKVHTPSGLRSHLESAGTWETQGPAQISLEELARVSDRDETRPDTLPQKSPNPT